MEKTEKILNEGREGIYAEKEKGEKEYADPLCGGACISGTESMEGLLTVVSEEAARRNVEKRLRGNMETEKKAV